MADFSKALIDLDEAIRLDPSSAKGYQNRAATQNGLGRYELALRDAEEAIRLDPRAAGAINNRAVALIALNRPEQAIDALTDALGIDPKLVSAHVTRAEAYLRLGQVEQAISDFEDVARLDPSVAAAAPGLVQINGLLKRRGQATGGDALALRQAVSQATADFERANSRRSTGDWPGAIAAYTETLRGDPNHADAYSLRGWSRLCAGEPGAEDDARAALDRKGWRDPFAPYLALLGIFAARAAGHEEAASVFLQEALANTRPPTWPSPLFRYLRRTISSTALLADADDPNKATEARAVIGQDLFLRGERGAAAEHLRWVAEQGADGSIARDLAKETLRRINATTPVP